MILLYGILGACIAGIPLALLLISQSCSNAKLKQQMIHYKKYEEQGLYMYVWILNKDIADGEKVERADLEKKKIWIPESDDIDTEIDIQQITGKKARTHLKKGTVMQSDLLYHKKKQKNVS